MNKTSLSFVALLSIIICIICLSEDSLAQTKRSIPKSVTTQKIISNPTPKEKTPSTVQTKKKQPVKTIQKTVKRQVQGSIFKRIETKIPETIIQGEPFYVTYKLYANEWNSWKWITKSPFSMLHSTNNKIKLDDCYCLEIINKYQASSSGDFVLPSFEVIVGDVIRKPDSTIVHVDHNKEYGTELDLCQEWLLNHGGDSVTCQLIHRGKYYSIFSDLSRKCFAIIARQQYWDLLQNPVLAYSTESALSANNLKNDDGSTLFLLSQYDKQFYRMDSLKQAGRTVKKYVDNSHRKGNRTDAFLKNIQWGQRSPYNSQCIMTGDKHSIAGCVPIAVGQILKYYSYPKQGMSHTYFIGADKKYYEIDYKDWKIDWEKLYDTYLPEDNRQDTLSIGYFIESLQYGLNVQFKPNETQASLFDVKRFMCNNLGYSTSMTLHHRINSDEKTLDLIYRDLDQMQPCIVSSTSHAFICDGYDGPFLHYNLGWKGFCNGYYQAVLFSSDENVKFSNYEEILTSIYPKRTLKKTVSVNSPGELASKLTEEEKQGVTDLAIFGPLNTDDIKLLRKMAGYYEENLPETEWRGGNLSNLDLRGASLTKDKNPFLAKESSETWTYTESNNAGYYHRSTYDMKNMTDKEWKKFRSEIGSKQEGYYYDRTEDHRIIAHYYMVKDKISPRLFSDCTSLQHVILPHNVISIDDYAFWGCVLLQEIRIPSSVSEIGNQAFAYCTSLDLVINKPKTVKYNAFDKCSPIISFQ